MHRFIKKSPIIKAIKLKIRTTIETQHGLLTGEAGDWVIAGMEGVIL